MTAEQAARDVKLGIYARWREPERILPNIMRLYQEFRDELDQPLDGMAVFEGMRKLRAEWHGHAAGEPYVLCVSLSHRKQHEKESRDRNRHNGAEQNKH